MLRLLSGMAIGGILGWTIAELQKKGTTLGRVDTLYLRDPLDEKFAQLELEDYVEKELARLKEQNSSS